MTRHPAIPTTHSGTTPPRAGGSAAARDTSAALAACRRLSAGLDKAATLEAKQRLADDDSIHVPLVRFVEAQIRMRLAPALAGGWPDGDPVHLVLFGGTNSGKSTVLNLLLGRPVAGMDALPRFSQHPEGFSATLPVSWFDQFPPRFEGYAKYLNQHPPRQTDAELRQGYKPAVSLIRPAVLMPTALAEAAAPDAVLWDVPDFSTVQARAYMRAVIDAAAMADVIVVTVTTESYLDDRGGALLNLLVDSGAMVHVVANKMTDDPQLLAEIRASVGTNSRGARLEPAAVHQLPLIQAADPMKRLEAILASSQGTDLRQALATEAARSRVLKRRTLIGCLDFVERRLGEAVGPLDREANVGRFWEDAVDRHTRTVILDRYVSDYVNTDRYGEFNRTLARLMELVEVPIISDILKGANKVLRIPINWVKKKLGITRSPTKPPEEEVLTDLIDKWSSALRSEAQRRQEEQPHPGWAAIIEQLDSTTFRDRIYTGGFAAGYVAYREQLEQVEKERAEALYNKLAERPVLLNSLRLLLAGADATTLFLTIKTLGGVDWSDLVVGPIMLKVRRWFTEKGLGAYLESQKEQLITWQRAAISTLVLDKLATPARALFSAEVSTSEVEQIWDAFRVVKAALGD